MGVVHGREQPVVNWEPKIVVVQLDQGSLQFLGLSESNGKCVCLELKFATQTGHEEVEKAVVGRGDELEDDHEPDQNWPFAREPEGGVQDLVLVEIPEESKHEEDVDLADDDILQDMIELPMAKLMGKNSQDLRCVAALLFVRFLLLFRLFFFFLRQIFLFLYVFLRFQLLSFFHFQQSVEEDDSLEVKEPVEVGIGMGRPDKLKRNRKLNFTGASITSEHDLRRTFWIPQPQTTCTEGIRC